ncbi:MAG TPA: Flp family type IVb pilin [Mycobacteriales bacterium]|nr:Flp family type IVb pilin [Mycobacteriales bacterium]
MLKLYVTLLTVTGQIKDRWTRDDDGATAVEYGLMVALIAVAIIGAVFTLGGKLNDLFTTVSDKLP